MVGREMGSIEYGGEFKHRVGRSGGCRWSTCIHRDNFSTGSNLISPIFYLGLKNQVLYLYINWTDVIFFERGRFGVEISIVQKKMLRNKINQLIHEISLVFVVGTTIATPRNTPRVNGQLRPESEYSFFLVLKLE